MTQPAPSPDTPNGSALQELIGVEDAQTLATDALDWVQNTLLTFDVGLQVALVLAAIVPAAFLAPRLKDLISKQIAARLNNAFLKRAAMAFAIIASGIALYIVLTIFLVGLRSANQPADIISAAISLMTAWIVIRLVTLVIRSDFWSRVAFYIAWPIAALDAFGVLDNVVEQLRSFAIPLGENEDGRPIRFTLFDVIRTLFYFGILFWGASLLGKFVEARIQNVEELTPSLKALMIKIMNVVLPVVALIIALQIAGFNLATLTVFGGAVGLGIGLGLQKTVSNFVAGFTLIADKSIKPGDVIEIDERFGWVTSMQARYVSVRTRDGTEHLVPNEKFMTDGVINWSKSDKVIRLHAPFGICYTTKDMRLVQRLASEAAQSVERVVDTPQPVCNLMEMGDSSVNFDLRFWIRDPQNGIANVRSDVYLALWDLLHEHQITIPYPHRELYIRSWPQAGPPVVVEQHDAGPDTAQQPEPGSTKGVRDESRPLKPSC